MKHIRILLFIATLSVMFSCNNQMQNESTDLATPVTILEVGTSTIREFINTSGTVYSKKEVELTSELVGKYNIMTNPSTGRPYKLGDRVNAGDVIIRLENKEYENNIAIDASRLNLEISQQNYEKQQSLFEKGGVTESELNNAQISKVNAEYSFENAELNLAKMNIIAPFDGIIVTMPYYTPDVDVASGSSMVTLMAYNEMYLEFNLPEKNIPEVEVGQEVWITSYTLPDDTLFASILDISPAVSSETRTFSGRITINNSDYKLRPGMFIKASIVINTKEDVIVIPKDVIVSGNRGKNVFIADNTAARERIVTTGIESDDNIEVTSGLVEGDRLVVEGYETLRNGSRINVTR